MCNLVFPDVKISIVTVMKNSALSIEQTILSVHSQTFPNIEYILIDGVSTDGSLNIIKSHMDKIDIFLSETDTGIYDALNKGFALATGDIIGILHSDDVFQHNSTLALVADSFIQNNVDFVYGDITMIDSNDRVVREWKAGFLNHGRITSTQIPHPALFLSSSLVSKLHPVFDTSYKICADNKQQLIFANVLHSKGYYIPQSLVRMKTGGTSTSNLIAFLNGWIESRRAWNEVHGVGGFWYVLKKVFSKFSSLRF